MTVIQVKGHGGVSRLKIGDCLPSEACSGEGVDGLSRTVI